MIHILTRTTVFRRNNRFYELLSNTNTTFVFMFRHVQTFRPWTTTTSTTALQPQSSTKPTTSMSSMQSKTYKTINCVMLPICSTSHILNINKESNAKLDLDGMFAEPSSSDDDINDDITSLHFERFRKENERNEKKYQSVRYFRLREENESNEKKSTKYFKQEKVKTYCRKKRSSNKRKYTANIAKLHYFDLDFSNCTLSLDPIELTTYQNYSCYHVNWEKQQDAFFRAFAHAQQNIKIF